MLIVFKVKLKTELSNIHVLQNLVYFKTALGSWQDLIQYRGTHNIAVGSWELLYCTHGYYLC